MTPERWHQVEDIFEAALERDPDDRLRLVRDSTDGDDLLRKQVEQMLAAHHQSGNFLESTAIEIAARNISLERSQSIAGTTIGHYKIDALIGAGGMGEVFAATDTRIGRRVALKLLPEYFSRDARRVRQFEQEARAVTALNHPNIVTIYEIDRDAEQQFIASEFIDGMTLRERLAGEPLPLITALDIAIQVGSALADAHDHGIVHRDIKPENIMLRPDGYVKVLDFGIAKLIESEADKDALSSSVETHPGKALGTAAYMSPEQARGLAVDARTDIWSVGIVIYEMIAGRTPFAAETATDCMDAIVNAEAPHLRRYVPEAPKSLEVILATALTKDRGERYQAAGEMVGALKRLKQSLEAAVENESVSNESVVATGASSAAADSAAPAYTTSAQYIVSEIKRHKFSVGGVVALALILTAATFITLYKFTAARKPIPQTIKLRRITSSGSAGNGAISPDGKYVAYSEAKNHGKQSLWVKLLATGTPLEVVPAADTAYRGVTFSRDGSVIYYVISDVAHRSGALFSVPVIGGPAKQLLTGISGAVAQSPDRKRLAFVYHQEKSDSLMIANADGSDPRALAVRTPSEYFSIQGPAWSPDGKSIAVGGIRTFGGYYANVFIVKVDSGEVTQLTTTNWKAVRRIEWSSDGATLALLANDAHEEFSQLWEVTFPKGEARRITNDLNGHGDTSLGLSADRQLLMTAQEDQIANLWLTRSDSEEKEARQLTTGSGHYDGIWGVSWSANGDIFYEASLNGKWHMWRMTSDGSQRTQLTNEAYEESFPMTTADGKFIVFKALGTDGTTHLWRMSVDGGQVIQLTSGEDHSECISPDGQSVIYSARTNGKEQLWKVSINGGQPVRLSEYVAEWPDISADGKLIAAAFLNDSSPSPRWQIAIIPSDGGRPLQLIDLPPTGYPRVHWLKDGRAIAYIDTREGVANLVAQPLDGGPSRPLTKFASEQIFSFAFSPDGKGIVLSRGSRTSDIILISDFN